MENLNNLNNIKNTSIIFKVSNYEVKENNFKNSTMLKKKTTRNKNELPLFWKSGFGKNFKPLKIILKMLFRKRKKNNITEEHYNFKKLIKQKVKIARNFYNDLCKKTNKNNLVKVNCNGDLINLTEEEEKTKNELIANINEIMQMKEKYIKTIRKSMKNLPSFWRSQFGKEFMPLKGIQRKLNVKNNNLTQEENELNEFVKKLIYDAKNFYDGLCEETTKNNLIKVNTKGTFINLNEEEEKTKNELTTNLNELKKNHIRPMLKPIKKRQSNALPSFTLSNFSKDFKPLMNLKYNIKKRNTNSKDKDGLITLIKKNIETGKTFYTNLCEKTTKNLTKVDKEGTLINLNEKEEKTKNELIKNLNKLKQNNIRPTLRLTKKRKPMEDYPSFWNAPISQDFKSLVNLKYNILRKCKEKQKSPTKKQKNLIKLIDSKMIAAKNFYNDLCESTNKDDSTILNLEGNLINIDENEEEIKNELMNFLNEINKLKQKNIRPIIKPIKKRKPIKNLPSFWDAPISKDFKPLINLKYNILRKCKEKQKPPTKKQKDLIELIDSKMEIAKNFYNNLCEETTKNNLNKVNLKGNLINLNEEEEKIKDELTTILNELKEKHVRPKKFANKITKKRRNMKNLPHFWTSSFGKNFKPLQNMQRNFHKKRNVKLTKEQPNLKELIKDTIYNAKFFYDFLCEKTNKKISNKVNSKGNPINLNKDEKRTQNNLLKILNKIKEKHIRPKQN